MPFAVDIAVDPIPLAIPAWQHWFGHV